MNVFLSEVKNPTTLGKDNNKANMDSINKISYASFLTDIICMIKGVYLLDSEVLEKIDYLVCITYEYMQEEGYDTTHFPPLHITHMTISYLLEEKEPTLKGYYQFILNFLDINLKYIPSKNTRRCESAENCSESEKFITLCTDYFLKVQYFYNYTSSYIN